jgi:hypothetical protein
MVRFLEPAPSDRPPEELLAPLTAEELRELLLELAVASRELTALVH